MYVSTVTTSAYEYFLHVYSSLPAKPPGRKKGVERESKATGAFYTR